MSFVLALALTAAFEACCSDEPSGGIASTPTETPASLARTPSTTVAVDAPTATVAPRPTATTAPPAASGSAETDREALAALYNATGREKWLSDAPLSEWNGVKTDDDGRVIKLDLSYNELSGTIPPDLANLGDRYFVKVIDLSKNQLSGEIPSELCDSLDINTWFYDRNKNEIEGQYITPDCRGS